MFLYKSNSGLLLSLLLNFIFSSVLMLGLFVITFQYDGALYILVIIYSMLALLTIWNTVYQSSNASFVEQNGILYHFNGFRRKSLGQMDSLVALPVRFLPFVYKVAGDESRVYCLKVAYTELLMKREVLKTSIN